MYATTTLVLTKQENLFMTFVCLCQEVAHGISAPFIFPKTWRNQSSLPTCTQTHLFCKLSFVLTLRCFFFPLALPRRVHALEKSWTQTRSPVEMLLHHLGDGAWHGSLLRTQAAVQVQSQLLLQEVDDELWAAHLLLVVLDPWHFPLRRKLPIKEVLGGETKKSLN